MPVKRRFFALLIPFAVFCSCLDCSSTGAWAAGQARSFSEPAPAGTVLWKRYPEGGGYFQQRQDAPIILISNPPRLPASAVSEEAAGRHGRTAQKKIVPSFIPDEAMETGAFSGGL